MAASAVAGATDAAEWLQGARLSVVTTDNAVVEGDVYACDPPAEVLVLRELRGIASGDMSADEHAGWGGALGWRYTPRR